MAVDTNRLSQIPVTVGSDADTQNRVSQIAVTVGWPAISAQRVSQLPVTVGSQILIGQRVSQIALTVGWVTPPDPEITFPEGGDVGIGLTWAEITDKQNTLRVHAKVALPDPKNYYGGFKDDRVIQWGVISRALSDYLGQYEAAEFTFLQADTDRLYRGIGDSAFTKVLKNRPVTVRMIDDPSRRAGLTPRTMMRGIVREYQPVAPLGWQWTVRDFLAAKFSAENTKDQLPTRLITRADFQDCPTGVIGLPVPIIYGAHGSSASTATPPVITGTSALGSFVQDGYRAMGFGPLTSGAAVPTGVTVGLAAGGTLPGGAENVPNGEYGIIVTAVDVSGNESDPHVYYTSGPNAGRGSFADGPLSPAYVVSPDGTEKIQVSWSAAVGAVKYRVYLGTYYYGAGFQQMIEVDAPTTSCEFTTGPVFGVPASPDNITPGAQVVTFRQYWWYGVSAVTADGETTISAKASGVSAPYRRPLRLEWDLVAGATGGYKIYRGSFDGTYDRVWSVAAGVSHFDDDLLDTGVTFITGAPVLSGLVPVTPVGTEVDAGGASWYRFLVGGHACYGITQAFQGGVAIDPGRYGVDIVVPGQAGYSTYFPNTGSRCQYRDINGNRYTLVYMRGPYGQAAADGSSKLTLNVQGIETVGDSSGELITDGLLQYKHAWKNWLMQTYRSGAWLSVPYFGGLLPGESAVPQLDEDSFDAAAAVAAARFSGGYVGAWMLGAKGERITIRDCVARLNTSFDVDSGFNRKTQFFVRMVDDSADALDAGIRVIDVREVHAGTFGTLPANDEHFNVIPYRYAADYTDQVASGGGWTYETSEQDDQSIEDLDGEEKTSTTIDMHAVRNAAQAQDVVLRRLQRQKDVPLKVQWTMGMSALAIELGDLVLLTHFSGMGSSGYRGRPVRITRHEVNPDTFTVTLEGYDLARIYQSLFILGDETLLPSDWLAAGGDERLHAYLADEGTGKFTDGEDGKRLSSEE